MSLIKIIKDLFASEIEENKELIPIDEIILPRAFKNITIRTIKDLQNMK
jgi:hypothetical protein